MASIAEQTFSDGADRKLVITSGEQFIGKLGIGTSWTDLRIGMQVQIDSGSNIASAIGAMGVCASLGAVAENVRGFGDNDCDHFVGMGFTGALNAGQTLTYYTLSSEGYLNPPKPNVGKKVGATVTNVVPSEGSTLGIANISGAARRSALFVRIVKGSPNYSITVHGIFSNSAGDISRAAFLDAISVDGDPTIPSRTVLKYTGVVPVTEGDGGLDCVNVSWNKSAGLHIPILKVWRFD